MSWSLSQTSHKDSCLFPKRIGFSPWSLNSSQTRHIVTWFSNIITVSHQGAPTLTWHFHFTIIGSALQNKAGNQETRGVSSRCRHSPPALVTIQGTDIERVIPSKYLSVLLNNKLDCSGNLVTLEMKRQIIPAQEDEGLQCKRGTPDCLWWFRGGISHLLRSGLIQAASLPWTGQSCHRQGRRASTILGCIQTCFSRGGAS